MWGLIKEAVSEWIADNPFRLSAALAFYTIFSLAPTLLIVMAVSTLFVDRSTARMEMARYLTDYLGPNGASFVLQTLSEARTEASGPLLMVIGLVTLLFGATAVFSELQDALNDVWDVDSREGVGGFFYRRLIGFTMVLGVGVMLMLSVTTSTVLSFVRRTLEARRFLAGFPWQTVDFLVSFILIALMFAMLYKFVPDVDLGWRDVAVGALITAMLFTIGKSLIGLYLGSSGLRSVYGAAGSLVVLLVWIYYSAQVFFLGAEITQAWVRRYGSGLDRAG